MNIYVKLALILVVNVLFSFNASNQTRLRIVFIAFDSLRASDSFVMSRIVVATDKEYFVRPQEVSISLDSINANFGIIEVQFLDPKRTDFIAANVRFYEDKIPEYRNMSKNIRGQQLDTIIPFLPYKVLQKGLYRSRVKLLLSNYNPNIQDVYSNWSYFDIR